MQNGKHAIARNLIDRVGFGTTEFHVLHPGPQVVAEWVHYYLRQPAVLEEATAHFTGSAGQQRLPDSYLAALDIPVPPLEEQKRIAGILKEQMAAVERARTAAEAQLEAAKALPAAHLRAVFNSPAAKSGPSRRLGDLLQLRKEVVHPRDNPTGRAVFVGLEHIEPYTGTRTGSQKVETSELIGRKPRFYKGDIVYGYLRPYLNKVWVAGFDGLCSVDQYVYKVSTEGDATYLAWFMRSPVYLERAPINTTPGQLPRIRTEEVAAVELNLPPLWEQRRIVGELTANMVGAQKIRQELEKQLPGSAFRREP